MADIHPDDPNIVIGCRYCGVTYILRYNAGHEFEFMLDGLWDYQRESGSVPIPALEQIVEVVFQKLMRRPKFADAA